MNSNISYRKNAKLVTKNKQKYIYKIKRKDKTNIYNYLKSKDFQNYLPYTELTNEYEVYRYINDNLTQKEDKAIELVYTLSMLHIKTTIYQEIDIDKTKEIYENTKSKINDLRIYYLDLQDYIETKVYMSPAEYLLMKNISKFYKSLNYAEQKIDMWYQEKTKLKKERLVQLHNNIKLEHFLVEDIPYFISWDKSERGLVVFDFLNFYQNEYQELEMSSLFDIYQSKYRFSPDELLLFQALLAIPTKVTFEKTNYINTLEVKKRVEYIEKTNKFLSKYYEKNQKSNDEKFE